MDHSPKPREITSRFEKLLVALAADGVDFAVVGGVAVIFNGYPRLTLDVDILVHDGPENLRKLLACLAGWGKVGRANSSPRISFTIKERFV